MSNFLGNLIGRHKEYASISDGTNSNIMPLVKPRATSRYELEPSVSSESIDDANSPIREYAETNERVEFNSQYLESHIPSFEEGLSQQTQHSAPIKDRRLDAFQKEPSNKLDISNNLINVEPPRKNFLLNELAINSVNKNTRKRDSQSENNKLAKDVNKHALLEGTDFDKALQSVLYRLKSIEGNTKNTNSEHLLMQYADTKPSTDTSIKNNSEQRKIYPSTEFDDASLNLNDDNTKNIKSTDSQSVKPNPHGALNVPSWLSDMKSVLNKRQQDANAKLEIAKPIVNVTIGRVEVRAVQSSSVNIPKKSKKPSGVMSLTDYLKSRDKKERA